MSIEQYTHRRDDVMLGACGERGYRDDLTWADPRQARALARRLVAATGIGDVVQNPHLTQRWARELVATPALLRAVTAMIGPDVAVENTFLMTKRPGGFVVPPHQDGTNPHILLDPCRAVTIWLAITDATVLNGCLQVAPGSHLGGYLQHRYATREPGRGAPLTAVTDLTDDAYTSVELRAGQACAMDMRLLHRSGPNGSHTTRIGLNVRYVAPGGFTVLDGNPPPLCVLSGSGF